VADFEYRDFSGEKFSVGDRVRIVGGGDDPKWRGRGVEIYDPEPLPWPTPNPVLVPPTVKILFDDGEEDEFSGWRDVHWCHGRIEVYDFDDLERL